MKHYVFLESAKYGVIRAIHTDCSLLLCATDIARALGYKKPRNAACNHCVNMQKLPFPTSGGKQFMSFITAGEAWYFCRFCNRPGAEALAEYLFGTAIPAALQRLAFSEENLPQEPMWGERERYLESVLETLLGALR